MTKQGLRYIIDDLENACFRLDLQVADKGDEPGQLGALVVDFQRQLDLAQQRLDDVREPPETRIAAMICPRCGMTGRLLWHYDAGTCVEEHGEPGWAAAKRLARDGEPTDF